MTADTPEEPRDARRNRGTETTEVREERRRGRFSDMGPGGWIAAALAVLVLLLLLFAAMGGFDDDGGAEQDVEVTQEQNGGTTVEDENGDGDDTIIIEPADGDGTAADGEATAVAEGGDVVVQERRDGQRHVEVNIDERPDLEQFDDATFRAPASTELTMRFENDTDETYNAYFSAGETEVSPTIASMEPFIEPGQVREETFTTPQGGTFSFRIEDTDGNVVMDGTVEIEER